MSDTWSKTFRIFARAGAGLACGALLLIAPSREGFSAAYPSVNNSFRQQSQTRPEPLVPNTPIERKLSGGESHLYEINLTANQFLRLLVEQRGVDVVVIIFSPEGARVREVDNRHGERGLELVSLVAKRSGNYRIEIRGLRKTALSGSYQISLDELRPADTQAQAIDAAEQLVAEGNTLRATSTKDSLTQAIAKYREALLRSEDAGDLRAKAIALNLIGRSYSSLGEYRKSLDYYHQALSIARAISDREAEAATLAYLGDGYRQTAENEKALEYLTQAVEGWQIVQDRRGEVGALNILARVYFQLGDQYKAIYSFDRALHLARILSDQSLEVDTLGGMGLSYYSLGDNEKAVEIWKQELVLVRAGVQTGKEANVLSKLGSAYGALGKTEESLDYLNQSIKLARDRGDLVDEAGSLQTVGRVYRSIGEPGKSIEYLEQSLVVLNKVNNPPTSVARAHYNLGKAYTDLGEYEKAISYLNEALLVWRSRNDPINTASTIRELARAERGRGNLQTALTQSRTAVNLIEWLRAQAGGQEQRAAYLASVQDYFELQIDVLTRLHQLDPARNYAAEALQTSERARARSLLEAVAEAGIDIRRGVSPELLQRERTITEQLSNKASERAHLAGIEPAPTAVVKLDQEIKELTAQYDNVEAQIRSASPAYGRLFPPQPVSLAEIREQVIDGDTLLLEYYLGADRSYLWAVTSTSINVYELPKRSVIESSARQVYGLLTARNLRARFETTEERAARVAKADVDTAAATRILSDTVLGPVAALLNRKRLLVVSDGALQYVPFAALPKPDAAGRQPLAATSEVVSLPSASTLAVLRHETAKRQPAPKTIAVLADPVFNSDDERMKAALARNRPAPARSMAAAQRSTIVKNEIKRAASESGWESDALSMARLPFTRREADVVLSLVPATLRREQLDFDANLANAINGDLAQYRIVHFATHGFLNSRHPELSGIVLSLIDENGQEQDGFLRAHQIYDLKLPADLVVLSGCRTGLGKEIRGEGLIGLTRAFMHAGSARVLVSLWDVNDEATAELMRHFYTGLLGPEKLSPATALRAAQISMSADKRWSAPYYWAGFVLQGEPR
jgi:CHAT domain-containing protein/tetratricopeptide (TPR) repeat protein